MTRPSLFYLRSLAGFVLAAAIALPSQAATLVHNVRGYTMNAGERVEFAALEYEDGVISAVYPDAASAQASTADQRIDGGGATMLPGLIDAHGHVAGLGEALASVDLVGVESEREAAARVGRRAAQDSGRPWP